MGRTLLSDAFEVGLTGRKIGHPKGKTKIKDVGQECPAHTSSDPHGHAARYTWGRRTDEGVPYVSIADASSRVFLIFQQVPGLAKFLVEAAGALKLSSSWI